MSESNEVLAACGNSLPIKTWTVTGGAKVVVSKLFFLPVSSRSSLSRARTGHLFENEVQHQRVVEAVLGIKDLRGNTELSREQWRRQRLASAWPARRRGRAPPS